MRFKVECITGRSRAKPAIPAWVMGRALAGDLEASLSISAPRTLLIRETLAPMWQRPWDWGIWLKDRLSTPQSLVSIDMTRGEKLNDRNDDRSTNHDGRGVEIMIKRNSGQILIARRLAGAAGLLVMAGTAGAGDIFDVSTSGSDIGYWVVEDPVADPCTVAFASPAPVDPVLSGILQNATGTGCSGPSDLGPGGYIELGTNEATVWSGVRTLTGKLPAGAADFEITLSSLLEADWSGLVDEDGLLDGTGLPLAQQYIRDVIKANCNGFDYVATPPSPPFPTLQQLATCFLSGASADCTFPPAPAPSPIVPSPATKASDPNIPYVQRDELATGRPITIGLIGPTNSTDVLPPGFVCPVAPFQAPDPLILTEVVKVTTTCNGTPSPTTQYLYGFEPRYASGMSGVSGYEQVYEVSPITGDCYLDPEEQLILTKTADPQVYSRVGDVITYEYELLNSTSATLASPFTVEDDRIDDVTCPDDPPTLLPGESITCTGSYTITLADLGRGEVTNTATATAIYKDEEQETTYPITSEPDQATVTYESAYPPPPIPALGLLGQIVLGLLMLITAGWQIRKRRR